MDRGTRGSSIWVGIGFVIQTYLKETHIPPDICREIFLQFPATFLIRLRAVCKAWRAVIDDPCFVRAHTTKQLSSNTILIGNSTALIRNSTGHPFYYFDLETLSFTTGLQTVTAAPLNFTRSGLSSLSNLPVCKVWEIWNPLSHERLELPQRDLNWHASGIGYDYATDDYKVVVIVRPNHGREEYVYQTHVYSLKSDSWRKIMNCPCDDWLFVDGTGVFLCGALHWILRGRCMITALDLRTENYYELKLPPLHERDRDEMVIRKLHLGVLGGCLFVSDYGMHDYDSKYFDVWVMKDYPADISWTKLFSVAEFNIIGPNLRPVTYIKNKMQVFLQDHLDFYVFNLENNSAMKVSIHGLSRNLSAQVLCGSIFRLHDNCGVGGRSVSARERRISKTKSKMEMADKSLMFYVRDAAFCSLICRR